MPKTWGFTWLALPAPKTFPTKLETGEKGVLSSPVRVQLQIQLGRYIKPPNLSNKN